MTGESKHPVPHAKDCDSLDCPCYRNGQDDVLTALQVLDRMGMIEARDRILATAPAAQSGREDHV